MATQTGSIDLAASSGVKFHAEGMYSNVPNMSPYYSADLADIYDATDNPDGYWASNPVRSSELGTVLTQGESGWAHVSMDNSERSGNAYLNCYARYACLERTSTKHTLLIEVRGYSGSGGFVTYQQEDSTTMTQQLAYTSGSTSLAGDGEYRIVRTSKSDFTGCTCAIRLTMRLSAGAVFDGDIRVSIYEGEYKGPYKPYSGKRLFATSAELKVEADRITSEVAARETLGETVAEHSTAIEQTANNVLIKATESDTTAAQGGQHLIQSLINVAPSGVKIQASKVEIDGTAIFTAISSDVDDAITGKGYATTTQAQGYASAAEANAKNDTTTKLQSYSTTTAMNQAISDSADSTLNSANAYADSLESGGHNILLHTIKPTYAGNYDATLTPEQTTGWYRYEGSITVTNTDDGIKMLHNTTSSKNSGFVIPFSRLNAVVGGDKVNLSFDYRGSITGTGRLYLMCQTDGNVYVDGKTLVASETDWQHFSTNITWPSTSGKVTYAVLVPYIATKGGWFEVKNGSMMLERGSKDTGWTPAPEDVVADMADVSTVASNAAPKSDAVYRQQRIWYRQTAEGAAPSTNTTWLATSGTGYGNWSLSVPQLTNGTTKYPKLYTAVQTQTVSQAANGGTTCSCSPVKIDDSTTVIDGGNIITGSVTANKLDAESVKADIVQTTNLSADKITSGDISADRIKANVISAINSLTAGTINGERINASQLTIGGSYLATQTDVDNVQVGVTNLLPQTQDWSGANKRTNGTYTVTSDTYGGCSVMTQVWGSGNCDLGYESNVWTQPLEADTWYTLSFWAKASANVDLHSYLFSPSVVDKSVNSSGRTATSADGAILNSITTSWQRIWVSWHIKANATSLPTQLIVTRLQSTHSGVTAYVAGAKLEKGNKASNWSPAPEDQTAYVDSSVDGIQVGATNLLLHSGESWPIVSDNETNENIARQWLMTNTYAPLTRVGNVFTGTKNASGMTNQTSGIRLACVTSSGTAASNSAGNSTDFGIDMAVGDTFTYSVDVRTDGNIVRLIPQYYNGSGVWAEVGKFNFVPNDTDWHRYSATFTIPSNFVCFTAFAHGMELTQGKTISIKNWKLERGDKATEWSPAPEDVADKNPSRNLLGGTQNDSWTEMTTSDKRSTYGCVTAYNTLSSNRTVEAYDADSNAVVINNDTVTGNRGMCWYTKVGAVKAGVTYTFSCMLWSSVSVSVHTHTAWRTSADSAYTGWTSEGAKTISANTWTAYSYTFTPHSTANLTWEFDVAICFTGNSSGVTFKAAHAQLEVGNTATAWDATQSRIFDASKTATNYISANSSGIKIANASPSTATTYQLQTATGTDFVVAGSVMNRINGDGMTLYDGSGTADSNVMAKFRNDSTQIGKAGAPHVTIASIGMDVYGGASGSVNLAHFGYDTGNAQSGTAVAPYYTLGERNSNSAIGNYSVSEGWNNSSMAYTSHAEGNGTTASGTSSHSEGGSATASGNHSHAEGLGTTASSTAAHAEGWGSTASGTYSHAQNNHTVASNENSTAIGRYNADANYALMIGNGTSDSARSNAMVVGWSGDVIIDGMLYFNNSVQSGGISLEPETIYEGTAKGNFTLSTAASAFTHIKVYFTSGNGGKGVTDVYNPDGSKFTCETTCFANSSTVQHEFAQWSISGTAVTWQNAGYVNLATGSSVSGSVTKLTSTTNQITINRVEGWTW